MEDTLREAELRRQKSVTGCLNPCFNGRYSQSTRRRVSEKVPEVLILVLMEDTLRAEMNYDKDSDWCLNPCFNGRYSQSMNVERSS